MKALKNLGTEGMYLNIMKAIYDKTMANIIQWGKMETISSKLENKQMCVLSHILEFLARVTSQEAEIKCIQIERKEVKLYLFVDNMILYLKDIINSTNNL
jgi:hypothetical protein